MDGSITKSPELLCAVREIMKLPPPEAADRLRSMHGGNLAYDLVLDLVYEVLEKQIGADITGHLEVLQILDPLYLRVGIRLHGPDGPESYCPAGKIAADPEPNGPPREPGTTASTSLTRWIVVDSSMVSADVSMALEDMVRRWPWWCIVWNAKGFVRAVADAVGARMKPWRVYRCLPPPPNGSTR